MLLQRKPVLFRHLNKRNRSEWNLLFTEADVFLFLFETLASTVKIESVTMVKTISTPARSANFKGGTHEVYKVRTSTSLTFKNTVSKWCVAA